MRLGVWLQTVQLQQIAAFVSFCLLTTGRPSLDSTTLPLKLLLSSTSARPIKRRVNQSLWVFLDLTLPNSILLHRH